MTRKIPLMIVTAAAALVFAVPAGAKSSIAGCLESTACVQPGTRPIDKLPRRKTVRPKIQPKLYTDGQQQTWRAGSHIMY
jgi:hypothetical protein